MSERKGLIPTNLTGDICKDFEKRKFIVEKLVEENKDTQNHYTNDGWTDTAQQRYCELEIFYDLKRKT